MNNCSQNLEHTYLSYANKENPTFPKALTNNALQQTICLNKLQWHYWICVASFQYAPAIQFNTRGNLYQSCKQFVHLSCSAVAKTKACNICKEYYDVTGTKQMKCDMNYDLQGGEKGHVTIELAGR